VRDPVPASSSALPEPALAPLPDTLLLRSQRPFWGAAARVWVAFALVAAALIFATGGLFWALMGLAVVAFFLFPALVFGLLRPIEKEVLAATPKTAPALLDALRNRRRVRLFAPFAWTAAQEGRLHLIRGDGRAAARLFAEAVRLGGLANDPPPSLVSAQAQALLVAEAPEQARELLQLLARRGALGPWERLHLGIALLLGGKVRVEEAREHVDAAQQALGGYARVLAARAWLVQRAGEGEAAIEALQAAETALHGAPDKLGQGLVERARRLLRPALKAQEKRARKHDRRGKGDESKAPVVEGTGAKGQVAAGRTEGVKGQASVVVKSEAPTRVVEATRTVAEATPAGGIVLALGPGTSAETDEREARDEAERPKGKKKARREERRAARRAAKAERRATQRTASPARPAVRTSAPAKVAAPVEAAKVARAAEKAKDQPAQVEKKVVEAAPAAVEAARVEKPAAVEAGVKDRPVAVEKQAAVEAGVKDRPAQVEVAVEAGVKDRVVAVEKPAAVEAGVKDRVVAVEKPATVEAGVKDRSVGPVVAPAGVAVPVAAQSGAVMARAAEVAQRTGVGPARGEQAPAPPSGSALFGGLGKAPVEVVATPGVGPGRLPTLRPGTARPEAPAAVAAPERASGPIAPPMKAPAPPVPAVPKFTSPSIAPPKAPAPPVTPPVAQAPVAKPVAPVPPVVQAPSGVAPAVMQAPSVAPSVAPAVVQAPSVAPAVVQAPVLAAPVAPVVQAPVLSAPVAPPVAVQAPVLAAPVAVAAPQPSGPAPQGPSDVAGAGDAEWDALLDAFDET
jgi:tetratricopeptide (TPR) repeat protein